MFVVGENIFHDFLKCPAGDLHCFTGKVIQTLFANISSANSAASRDVEREVVQGCK